jgi:periplasmic nitrate reductase NapE
MDKHLSDNSHRAPSTRQEEWRSFLFFTVVMAPLLAVIIVGGYGFLIWMYQLMTGPPGV